MVDWCFIVLVFRKNFWNSYSLLNKRILNILQALLFTSLRIVIVSSYFRVFLCHFRDKLDLSLFEKKKKFFFVDWMHLEWEDFSFERIFSRWEENRNISMKNIFFLILYFVGKSVTKSAPCQKDSTSTICSAHKKSQNNSFTIFTK